MLTIRVFAACLLILAVKFLEGADANPVHYEALIAVATGKAPAVDSSSVRVPDRPADLRATDVTQAPSSTYALMVTSSIWSGAKLVRCEAGSLSELVVKIAESCSLYRHEPDTPSGAQTSADATKSSAPLQLRLNGTILTEDTFATMPDRARITIEYGNIS